MIVHRAACCVLIPLLATACVAKDEVKVKKRAVVWSLEDSAALSLDDIQAKIDEDPSNPQPYFLLGEAYEGMNLLLKALDAYIEGTQRFENSPGYKPSVKYTGGHYRIGRVYARLGAYNEGSFHLLKVVKMEQEVLAEGKGEAPILQNPHFRESHFLLGACYNELLDANRAKVHFERFVELGGEPLRVAPHLARIDAQLEGKPRD